MKSMTKCAKDCQILAHRLSLGVGKKKKTQEKRLICADKNGAHLISAERRPPPSTDMVACLTSVY